MSERYGCLAGVEVDPRGAALADLCGRPLLERVVERLRGAALIDEVFVLPSQDDADFAAELERLGLAYRPAGGRDLRERYLDLATERQAQFLARVPATRPFFSPEYLDLVLGALRALGADLIERVNGRTRTRETEIFSTRALRLSRASGDASDATRAGERFFRRGAPALSVAELELEGPLAGFATPHADLEVEDAAALHRARSLWAAVDLEHDGRFPLARVQRWLAGQAS
jgi:spore coat polysaccharide biosynthesis protein SpsF (cytidylyltransferase family)